MRESPLLKTFDGDRLVGLCIVSGTATDPAPDMFETEIVRIFNEHKILKEENQSFGNVLAVIHRDGGHYITEHGHRKAAEDAIEIVRRFRDEHPG